jgi:integrase
VAHGDGRVYQPRKNGKPLGIWYYDVFFGGRRKTRRGFRTKRDAEDALKAERKRKARGEFVADETEVLRVDTVLDRYLEDAKERGKKSIASMRSRIGLLKSSLGSCRALDLRTDDVQRYRQERLGAGLNKATIDRDVETLRAAFRLAYRCESIPKVPYIPFYNVDNVKMRFFEPQETEALIKALPEPLSEIVRFVSLTGWRISEVLGLRWENVDMSVREVRLGTSKNGRPRTLALNGELWDVMVRRWEAREYKTKETSGIATHVFHRRGGRGVAYSAYRKEFVEACGKAGVIGKTTHDFRRTVARDLRRAGVAESVCMTITGHESPQVFRRYAIVATKEQEAAFDARAALLASEDQRTRMGHLPSILGQDHG